MARLLLIDFLVVFMFRDYIIVISEVDYEKKEQWMGNDERVDDGIAAGHRRGGE
jgi:hypothetical protein